MKFFIMSFLIISSSAMASYRGMALDPSDAYYVPPIMQPTTVNRGLAGYYHNDNDYILLQYRKNLMEKLRLVNELIDQPLSPIANTPYQADKIQVRCMSYPCPEAEMLKAASTQPDSNFQRAEIKIDPLPVTTERLDFNQYLDTGSTSLSQEY